MIKKRDLTPEQLARLNRRKILADIILIIVILAVGIYVFLNVEAVKNAGYNPCYLCEKEKGAYCFLDGQPIIWKGEESDQSFTINISKNQNPENP